MKIAIKLVLIAMLMALVPAASAQAQTQPKPAVARHPAHTNNYTRTTSSRTINMVVIHTAQGSYAGTIAWFANSASKVSAMSLSAGGSSRVG